jgi:hypothetical protein
MNMRRFTATLAGCTILLTIFAGASSVRSQQPIIDNQVAPASAHRSVPGTASARFTRRPSQVGDVAEQSVAHETRLTTSRRQNQEILESSTTTTRTRRKRRVTTTRTENGRTQAVLVQYGDAIRSRELEPPAVTDAADTPVPASSATTDPVSGKAYRCWREGDKLIVTDEQGGTPPADEVEVVSADMEAVGQANPLADFLAGRTVAIGETLALPKNVSERLFGQGHRFGQLTKFDLTLREIRVENGARCAVFQASVEAASHSSTQMRLHLSGPLIVEIDTCRTVSNSLSGPLAMSVTRGTHSTAHQLVSVGKLSMNIAARYHDAKR